MLVNLLLSDSRITVEVQVGNEGLTIVAAIQQVSAWLARCLASAVSQG